VGVRAAALVVIREEIAMAILERLGFYPFGPFQLINVAWILLVLYWLAASFNVKQPARAEAPWKRWSHVAFLLVGAFLLFKKDFQWPFLMQRLYPDAAWIAWFGAALVFCGVAFAIWARATLGRNWSGQIQIKSDHQLISAGPYHFVRHPIYTGILGGILGTAVAIGEIRGAIAFVLILVGFANKARKEESFLARQFGPAFEEHAKRTGFFLPRLS
jgi:protein-S-isoprenylcysteine O-methyltransferase Ste14